MRRVDFDTIMSPEHPEHTVRMPVNADLVCTIIPVPIAGSVMGPDDKPTTKLVAGLNFGGHVLVVDCPISEAVEKIFGKNGSESTKLQISC